MAKIIACVRWKMGLEVLNYLLRNHDIVSVISDEPTDFYKSFAYRFCRNNRIRYYSTAKDNWKRAFMSEHDLIISCSFNKILTPGMLGKPKFGALNIHQSLLPKYRGRSPVLSAILNKDSALGLTVHKMTSEVDRGPIYYQAYWILDYNKTMEQLIEQFIEVIPVALDFAITASLNEIKGIEQDETAATFCSSFDATSVRWDIPVKDIKLEVMY